jgi:hypothetical protein
MIGLNGSTVVVMYCSAAVVMYCSTAVIYCSAVVMYCSTVVMYCTTAVVMYCSTVVMYCSAAVVMYCGAAVVMYCSTGVVMYCSTAVVMYCSAAVVMYCSTVVMYCSAAVVMYCSTDVVMYQAQFYRIRIICETSLWEWKTTLMTCGVARGHHAECVVHLQGGMGHKRKWKSGPRKFHICLPSTHTHTHTHTHIYIYIYILPLSKNKQLPLKFCYLRTELYATYTIIHFHSYENLQSGITEHCFSHFQYNNLIHQMRPSLEEQMKDCNLPCQFKTVEHLKTERWPHKATPFNCSCCSHCLTSLQNLNN